MLCLCCFFGTFASISFQPTDSWIQLSMRDQLQRYLCYRAGSLTPPNGCWGGRKAADNSMEPPPSSHLTASFPYTSCRGRALWDHQDEKRQPVLHAWGDGDASGFHYSAKLFVQDLISKLCSSKFNKWGLIECTQAALMKSVMENITISLFLYNLPGTCFLLFLRPPPFSLPFAGF